MNSLFDDAPRAIRHLSVAVFVASLVTGSCVRADAQPAQPNILVIVADDLGFADFEIDNDPSNTPNLKQLSKQGVRFTRHYTDATCSPTRVGLLTGLDPARLGFRPAQQGVSSDILTLPRVLSRAGYNTSHIGKWHLGFSIDELSPTQAGFDRWFGFLHQFRLGGPQAEATPLAWPTYFDPYLQADDKPAARVEGHLTDILTDHAIREIDRLEAEPRPWFVNLWYYAPHAPIEPSAAYAEPFPDTDAGRYRALVHQLDAGVGKLMHRLRKSGVLDNTLVVFMSDNGGTNAQLENNHPLPGNKGQFMEGGLRTQMIWHWPERLAPGRTVADVVSNLDLLPTLAGVAGHDLADHVVTGKNLWPSIRGDAPFPKRELFWEYSRPGVLFYSVLDREGRWRLSHYLDDKVLYDVRVEANDATVNHAERHPEIVARLEQSFERWRSQQHEVRVQVESLGPNGAAKVMGDDVQRSPGHAGFTFAIGLTPRPGEPASKAIQPIAMQKSFWNLYRGSDGRLRLDLLGSRLRGPVLPEGVCSSVVVTSFYSFSPMRPKNNFAWVDLYVDGKRVDRARVSTPDPTPTAFATPTFIGTNSRQKRFSPMKLSTPRFFNERFVPAAESQLKSNTVEGLAQSSCGSRGS